MSGETVPYAGPWAGVFPAPAPVPSVEMPPRALRRLLGHSYASCRTIDDAQLKTLYADL